MPIIVYCQTCKHYWGMNICIAFPEGIPKEILAGEREHDRPYPGDKGYRYSPRKEGEPGA